MKDMNGELLFEINDENIDKITNRLLELMEIFSGGLDSESEGEEWEDFDLEDIEGEEEEWNAGDEDTESGDSLSDLMTLEMLK